MIDVLDDALAGAVGRVRLAGEDDLHRSLLIEDEPGQALLVGEKQRGALIRGEAPGKTDGQHGRVEHVRQVLEHSRRFAQPRKLALQPAPSEERQLQLLALVRFPQLLIRDAFDAFPEALAARVGVQLIEIRTKLLVLLAERFADP